MDAEAADVDPDSGRERARELEHAPLDSSLT